MSTFDPWNFRCGGHCMAHLMALEDSSCASICPDSCSFVPASRYQLLGPGESNEVLACLQQLSCRCSLPSTQALPILGGILSLGASQSSNESSSKSNQGGNGSRSRVRNKPHRKGGRRYCETACKKAAPSAAPALPVAKATPITNHN